MDKLRFSILKRLFLGWLLISLAALGGAACYSGWKADRLITAAAHEAFSDAAPAAADPGRLHFLIQKRLAWLRIYNHQGLLIQEFSNPAFPLRVPVMRELPRDGFPHLHRIAMGSDTLIQWLIPLRDRPGYLEGLTLVNPEGIRLMKASTRIAIISVLLAVAATALLLYPLMLSLNRRIYRFAEEILKGNIEIAAVLGAATAQRDSDTGHHNYRVTLYAIRLAEALREPVDMRALIMGAFLHDVGKIGIRDAVLLKPGPLEPEEFAIIQGHVRRGLDIIHPSHWLAPARDIIACHHEHFDGSGYPKGLKGRDIPVVARIFTVVDVFDALCSHRPYKASLPCDEALAMLEKASGHFDPELLAVFLTFARTAHEELTHASEVELIAKLLRTVETYRIRTLQEEGLHLFR